MNSEKKITPDQLRAMNTASLSRTIMWHGKAISVRTLLPIHEVSLFVNSVMSACYDVEHEVIIPEMMDFAYRVNVVSRYACVELPDDIEEQYVLLYNTDIYDTIIAAVNTAQLQSIEKTIGILIRFKG